ncbi:MAG: prepilin-type N-terminal cleavage/methylation domain-containing protein [Christensenellaceae bacterium]|nr:prepilin-type N-terminal cleavage/methylation domain-containing protein [Christensenellaceae bacterium]
MRKKIFGIIKNKKGFTFVEAIAVVAIMGVLATVIGGLVTSGTAAYMRQKESASAKDIASIVENEISRILTRSKQVYLEDGELPAGVCTRKVVIDGTEVEETYSISGVPFEGARSFAVYSGNLTALDVNASGKGYVLYKTPADDSVSEYFAADDNEKRAFYGSFKINLSFAPVFDAADKTIGIKIICDVYNSKDQLKYESRGTVVYLLESQSPSFSGNIVKTYKNDISALTDIVHVDGNFYTATYVDIIGADAEKEYTHLYFRY